VLLWAVDSLAGVVLSGMAQNAITASKLSSPRAMLWGSAAGALTWRRAGGGADLAGAGAGAEARAGALCTSLAAWVQPGQPVPMLCAAQQFFDAEARWGCPPPHRPACNARAHGRPPQRPLPAYTPRLPLVASTPACLPHLPI
jgi:hypothetical protein